MGLQKWGYRWGYKHLGLQTSKQKKAITRCELWLYEVEDKGFEPMTFWLPARRSPN
jgi:hypothetical protein